MREVSCLFATRWDKVLLATKDGGKNWHFPQEEVRRDVKGNPIETPLDAIYRIVDKLDGIEEEDVIPETSREYRSHRGEHTLYHVFMTDSKLDHGELRSNGTTYEWTSNPHSKNLNECTRLKLMEYTFFPET
ncbi:MAG: hypothetical protein UY74_C0068G0003 [Candidatus Kaiserbacteria bacterium GW2011_GWC2_52_8b]|uniref:Nudix hydrolase domain-containing protein n=2 Tax=Candidatus Kaiseribacteriota TaxID=1752734 RepID=A0A0G2AB79_9BACT|nr:MAG: hypothetical protein UY67_C0024G0023 [Candidatus Kaiserbacteria bacterium GW2011_GWA2_52_12]KKW29624.1 MAG: hypothetical protein UY74_C0068G0003 [Candidatus Kaiserbacteria bacterium GW2011_GWC2_52_8b]